MNIHPPKSIIILFVGMAAIAIGANFLKGAGVAGAAQITPNVVVSQSERTPAATVPLIAPATSAQISTPPPLAPVSPTSIAPRRERELREDE